MIKQYKRKPIKVEAIRVHITDEMRFKEEHDEVQIKEWRLAKRFMYAAKRIARTGIELRK